MSENKQLISSSIDVSPNEYVTKYAYNRNFLKLVNNDECLQSLLASDVEIQSYNSNKMYAKDQYVFYKLTPDSKMTYLLKSLTDANAHKPLAKKIAKTGTIEVVDGPYWKIVGVPDGSDGQPVKGRLSPKATALAVVKQSENVFRTSHELNTSEAAHPTGKLGYHESDVMLRSLANNQISSTKIQYPETFQSVNADNYIQHGYLRKWSNGLLEYDITFKLATAGMLDDGREQLCANSLCVYHRGQNNLYFQNDEDYNIFAKGGEDYAITNKTKQVNLNTNINSYSADIKFPEEFMDTNYMVFTTAPKVAETEALNTKDVSIQEYDKRLLLKGKTIVGYTDDAEFAKPLAIPREVVDIAPYALQDMEETNEYELIVDIPEDAQLKMINDYAFANDAIQKIDIRNNVRYIGENAFYNCQKLKEVNIYTSTDKAKQPKLAFHAFANTAIDVVNIHYQNDSNNSRLLFGTSEIWDHTGAFNELSSLEERLLDSNLRALYGFNDDLLTIYAYDIGSSEKRKVYPVSRKTQQFSKPMMKSASEQTSMIVNASNEDEDDVGYITIDVNEFLAQLRGQDKTISTMKAAPMNTLLKAAEPEQQLTDIIIVGNGVVLGYNAAQAQNFIDIDLREYPEQITAFSDDSLAGFFNMSSLTIPESVTYYGQNFLSACNLQNLNIIGSSHEFGPSAFASMTVTDMSIDMDNSFIDAHSFDDASLKTLHMKNLDKSAIKDGQVRGIGLYAFENCKVNIIDAYDSQQFMNISSSFINKNAPARTYILDDTDVNVTAYLTANCTWLKSGAAILTQNDEVIAYNKVEQIAANKIKVYHQLCAIPDYLSVETDSHGKTTLMSCDFDAISQQTSRIIIPNAIDIINVSALCPPAEHIDAIERIYVPNTITSIQDFAFAKNESLVELEFQNGINLEHLGQNIVLDCSSLNKFQILK